MIFEKRSFIEKEKYEELKNLLIEEKQNVDIINQIIYKFKSDLDFRLIRDKNHAYLRLRGSRICNEEVITNIDLKEVENLLITFHSLGMYEELKWYRKRITTEYLGYTVTLDETIDYGYVVSIGKDVSNIREQAQIQKELEEIFEKLQIKKITQEQFNDRYKYYKIHWVDIESKVDEKTFLNQQ